MQTSLGILETKGYATAIAAADKILEDISIDLIKVEKTGGGIISLFFKGETERLKAAFEKGIREARLVGEIVTLHILAKLNNQIEKFIFDSNMATILPNEKRETVQVKSILRQDDANIEKGKVEKRIKESEKLTGTGKKTKSSNLVGTTSTIQRLRREALSSAKNSKAKGTGSRIHEEKEQSAINMSVVENLSVHALRKLARSVNGFPIQGREISKANRKELVIYFKELA